MSKESCITVSQLSAVLGVDFEPALKVLIPVLLRQSQIHTKVLAQSASLCIRHVFRTCQAHRLLQLLKDYVKHKSVEIRREVFSNLELVVAQWDAEVRVLLG